MNNPGKVAFPECLIAPVLDIIRKYDKPLESLVNHIKNQLLETFLPGELVQFKLKQNSINIQGTIVKREDFCVLKDALSPSKNGLKTAADNTGDKLSSPTKVRKIVYSVKLDGKSEIITGVPGSDLRRCGYIPSKGAIRNFILKINATYEGADSGRWIIDDSLKDFLEVAPEMRSNALKELNSKLDFKRKLNTSFNCISKKQPESANKVSSSEPQVKRKRTKNGCKKMKLTLSPVWAKILKNASLEPEVVLVRLDDSKNKQKCIDSKNVAAKRKIKASAPVKEKGNGEEVKSPSPIKKMKQMTLFDMTKKLSPPKCACPSSVTETKQVATNASSPKSDALLSPGALAKKPVILESLLKNNAIPQTNGSLKKIKTVPFALSKSKKNCTVLNRANNIFVIHDTKGDNSTKGSKKEMGVMNTTEKAKMLLVIDFKGSKGASHASVGNSLKPLQLAAVTRIPPPKLIKTPAGFENHWFGETAMIIQFVSSFRGILLPDKSITLSIDSLMDAVISGSKGFGYIGNLLICLLRTLVEGADPDEFEVAGVSLQDIPINIYTVSEMTRLCLCSEKKSSDSSSVSVPKVVHSLADKEIYQLDPYSVLCLMCVLCTKLLDCSAVFKYVDEKRSEATKLRSERLRIRIEKKKALKLEKENMKEEAPQKIEENVAEPLVPKNTDLNPENFYGIISTGDSLAADLSLTIQSRKILAEKAQKEKEIAIKLKRERELKEFEELKKQKDEETFHKKIMAAEELDSSLRHTKPLGIDRNSSRYWLFSHSTPKFVIEKGWSMDMEHTDKLAVLNCEKDSDVSSYEVKNQWFTYEDEQEIKKLMANLSDDAHEKCLKFQLKKHLKEIVQSFESVKNDLPALDQSDWGDLVVGFREEIVDVESRIVEGTLGRIDNRDAWLAAVLDAKTCKEFASCLKCLQDSLNPRFICGIFAAKTKADDDGTHSIDKSGVDMWKGMLDSCTTMSGMHVLLGILASCVKWDRSSANQKCKVCRKLAVGDVACLLLCDGCNLGFHLRCLRPPLEEIPSDDWFCAACQKSRAASQNPTDSEGEEDDSEENTEAEDTSGDNSDQDYESGDSDMLEAIATMPCVKCKCKGKEKLVVCLQCYQCYHKECHYPPLRNYPRGYWVCSRCHSDADRSKRRSKRSGSRKRHSRSSLQRNRQSRSPSNFRLSLKSPSCSLRSLRSDHLRALRPRSNR